jgi:hypothetical protein
MHCGRAAIVFGMLMLAGCARPSDSAPHQFPRYAVVSGPGGEFVLVDSALGSTWYLGRKGAAGDPAALAWLPIERSSLAGWQSLPRLPLQEDPSIRAVSQGK